jgi:2'-5' RNA ligase
MSRSRRLFFALWPEETWAVRLIEAAALPLQMAGGRTLSAADLHVTLCFLGAVDQGQIGALRASAATIRARPFDLQFERLEFWPKARIIAATAAQVPRAGNALAQDLGEMARAAGLPPDAKIWRPHVTLVQGTGKPRWPDATEGAWPMLSLRLPVRQFYLAQSQGLGAHTEDPSQGERYDKLAHWPLGG